MNWIHVAGGRDRCTAYVNAVMGHRVPYSAENLVSSRRTVSCLIGTLVRGITLSLASCTFLFFRSSASEAEQTSLAVVRCDVASFKMPPVTESFEQCVTGLCSSLIFQNFMYCVV